MKDAFERYLRTLERTERMPLPALARYQEELLIRLVRHAYERIPFYRERLDCLFTAAGDVDLSRWNAVPVLKRDDVIAHGRKLRVAELAPEYGEIGEARTSGSSGVPLEVATNGLVFFNSNALLTRATRWWGLNTSRPLAALRLFINEPVAPYPIGNIKKGWSYAAPEAPIYELELMTPVEQQLEWLARYKAPYLLTQASGALALAHAVKPDQGRELGIEMIIAIGETIPDGTREFVAERLGARLAAIYSCQEIGTIATECSIERHYHVAAENALVEILDEKGRDVAPGERGRVIVTGIYNYVMPFIRYELGDIAVAGTRACTCGRTLPVITRIEGRTRNMFVFRDGSRVWPRSGIMRPMHAFVPFRQYQLVQLDYETIEFRYIPDGSGREPDLAGLNAHARKVFHPSVICIVRALECFAPEPSGKFEQFLSRVPAAARPAAPM
jgi:phenylacetate-CoA ligase